jgi:quercetin dioxygenase-like cupin family protein
MRFSVATGMVVALHTLASAATAKPVVTPLAPVPGECLPDSCVKGGIVTLQPGDRVGEHTHRQQTIVTVIDGELTLVEGAKTRVISAHQAAIEPSTVPHHAENRSQAPVTFIFTTVTGKDMPAFDPAP